VAQAAVVVKDEVFTLNLSSWSFLLHWYSFCPGVITTLILLGCSTDGELDVHAGVVSCMMDVIDLSHWEWKQHVLQETRWGEDSGGAHIASLLPDHGPDVASPAPLQQLPPDHGLHHRSLCCRRWQQSVVPAVAPPPMQPPIPMAPMPSATIEVVHRSGTHVGATVGDTPSTVSRSWEPALCYGTGLAPPPTVVPLSCWPLAGSPRTTPVRAPAARPRSQTPRVARRLWQRHTC
jgi:hypothetical protein